MKHIEKTIYVIEEFMNCNPERADGIQYTRNNFRDMYLKAMRNLDEDIDKGRIALMAESFMFIDDLLESLLTVPVTEVEDLTALIRNNSSN